MKFFSVKSFPFLILLSLMFMDFQCSECDNEIYDTAEYSISLNSHQEVFSIGDTLIMSSSISSLIPLVSSGVVHDNSNQAISYGFSVLKAMSDSVEMQNGVNDFEYLEIKGMEYHYPEISYQVNIESVCSDTKCGFELGIIPRKAGYYAFVLQSTPLDTNDSCVLIELKPSGIESIVDNNFNILKEINLGQIKLGGFTYEHPESDETLYFFKVVE